MRKYLLLVLFTIAFYNPVVAQQQNSEHPTCQISIDPSELHQTIDNFGASDAWSAQFAGNWPDLKRKAIAELLFSTENDENGQPKGIGLSLWRFNLGAGSSLQGSDSKIRDEWRRNPSFLDANGVYSWNQQAGQLWFLQAAKQKGVKQFVAFVNSPPVQFTKNHLAFSSDGASNISETRYGEFAEYLSQSLIRIRKTTGVKFDYLSPVNEPQWDWKDGTQEGNPYSNMEAAYLARVLDASLTKYKIKTKLMLPEAGQLNYLIQYADKKSRGDQIRYFFEDDLTRINALPHVARVVAGHSYFTTSPLSLSTRLRLALKERLQKVKGLKFWMTEYSILGDNDGEIKGGKRDLGIDAALYVARAIHQDLACADASAWQWWLAISPYNYKDGLIYIDKEKDDGNFYPGKTLWALGNYSRFIRPGATRLGLTGPLGSENSMFCSAYRNASGKEITLVVVNTGYTSVSLNVDVKGMTINRWQPYTTSATDDLKPGSSSSAGQPLLIPPRSVVSLLSSK